MTLQRLACKAYTFSFGSSNEDPYCASSCSLKASLDLRTACAKAILCFGKFGLATIVDFDITLYHSSIVTGLSSTEHLHALTGKH